MQVARNNYKMKINNLTNIIQLILCLHVIVDSPSARARVNVTVGPNKEVEVGDDLSLECVTHNIIFTFVFLIVNKIQWSFTDMNGDTKLLADGSKCHSSVWSECTSGHYGVSSSYPVNGVYRNSLNISNIQHSENGIYTCSFVEKKTVGENTSLYVIGEDSLSITVLNPVQSMRIEISDVPGASTHTHISQSNRSIKVQPGEHRILCYAFGSNPAPVMGLKLNEGIIYGSSKYTFNTSMEQIQYTGEFSVMLTFNASLGLRQTLVCHANVPNNQYPTKEVGLNLLIETDRPEIMCTNSTIKATERPVKLKCYITRPQDAESLRCAEVFWELPDTEMTISAKENASETLITTLKINYQVSCRRLSNGLETTLLINNVTLTNLEKIYYVRYGEEKYNNRVLVLLWKEVSSDQTIAPTLLVYMCLTVGSIFNLTD